ncbi:MAG TPA: hypothetical protein VGX94_00450 [Terriglobia bacterium]|nr:hypothetical protein [Terriglobia bacterium]
MKEALAERLLAKVMAWTPEDVARERPQLQAMASYKYDEYQQFSAGMRFVESLARWLDQFKSAEEKQIAYDFVKRKLVFCSSREMNHLVGVAYPDHIRPFLLRRTAASLGENERFIGKVANNRAFKLRQRRCLFLGLSDGAHVDLFRRANPVLRHDQILPMYEVSETRVDDLLKKLHTALQEILREEVPLEMRKFQTVVLLDDFSASAYSCLRKNKQGGFGGKIAKFCDSIQKEKASQLVNLKELEIFVVLYMATETARQRLEERCSQLSLGEGVKWTILVVYPLFDADRIAPGKGYPIERLIEAYYDNADETPSTWEGETDLKYGFNARGLPLVLFHNSPNDSLYLMWAENSEKIRSLFPRVSRHRAEV